MTRLLLMLHGRRVLVARLGQTETYAIICVLCWTSCSIIALIEGLVTMMALFQGQFRLIHNVASGALQKGTSSLRQ